MKRNLKYFLAVILTFVAFVRCEQVIVESPAADSSYSDSLTLFGSATPNESNCVDSLDCCRVLSFEETEHILANSEEPLPLKSLSINSSYYPNEKGSLYSTKDITIPTSGSYSLEFPRTSFSANYDFYAQVTGLGTYGTFGIRYSNDSKFLLVADNKANPAAIGEFIGFNTSAISGVKRNIPFGVKTIQVTITSKPGSKVTLKFYRKTLRQSIPWISQYKKGCGSDGFDNSYCGHTSLLMGYSYLKNISPNPSLIYPTSTCGSTKTPQSISDWLSKNLSKSGFCSPCGSGTYNPVWLKDCAKSFLKLQAEAWSSNSSDGADFPIKDKSVASLREQLTMGNVILVQTYIKNNPSTGITHWMILTDLTEDSSGNVTLCFHDPGRKLESDGKFVSYPLKTFTNCWYSKACSQRTVILYK